MRVFLLFLMVVATLRASDVLVVPIAFNIDGILVSGGERLELPCVRIDKSIDEMRGAALPDARSIIVRFFQCIKSGDAEGMRSVLSSNVRIKDAKEMARHLNRTYFESERNPLVLFAEFPYEDAHYFVLVRRRGQDTDYPILAVIRDGESGWRVYDGLPNPLFELLADSLNASGGGSFRHEDGEVKWGASSMAFEGASRLIEASRFSEGLGIVRGTVARIRRSEMQEGISVVSSRRFARSEDPEQRKRYTAQMCDRLERASTVLKFGSVLIAVDTAGGAARTSHYFVRDPRDGDYVLANVGATVPFDAVLQSIWTQLNDVQ